MLDDINSLLDQNEKLIGGLREQLTDSQEVVAAIKKGNIDALVLVSNKTAKVLVSKTSDESYRKFIENMSEGVVTIHPDGIILYCNSSFAKMAGLPLEKVIGANFKIFVPDDYMELFRRFLHDRPGKESRLELPLLNHHEIISYYIISLNKLMLKDISTLNLVITDVTDIKKAEHDLLFFIKTLKSTIDELTFSASVMAKSNGLLSEQIELLQKKSIKTKNNL